MFFAKTILVALLSLSAFTFAAPVDTAVNAVADINDGCNGANHHGACERGRDEKHQGYRDEHRGEREMARGQEHRGERNYREGQHEVRQGEHRECRAGGRC